MTQKKQSLILRIWLDESGKLYGQVSDPHSDWRRPFHSAAELWTLLSQTMADLPPLPPSHLEQQDVSLDDSDISAG
ncbi:MAG: hypothetical protein AAF629_03845 [Chloroflexota bacterium]